MLNRSSDVASSAFRNVEAKPSDGEPWCHCDGSLDCGPQTTMKPRSPELQALACNLRIPCILLHIACGKSPAGTRRPFSNPQPLYFPPVLCILLHASAFPSLLTFPFRRTDRGADPALSLAAPSIGITVESDPIPVQWAWIL